MHAYRFLRPGAHDALAAASWSAAGWLSPETGVVACRERDLPYRVAPELWIVELGAR